MKTHTWLKANPWKKGWLCKCGAFTDGKYVVLLNKGGSDV
jgi:hypothetical protein